jgi:hypothetical protein
LNKKLPVVSADGRENWQLASFQNAADPVLKQRPALAIILAATQAVPLILLSRVA